MKSNPEKDASTAPQKISISKKEAFEWIYYKSLSYYSLTIIGLLCLKLLDIINLEMLTTGLGAGLFLSFVIIANAFYKFIKE